MLMWNNDFKEGCFTRSKQSAVCIHNVCVITWCGGRDPGHCAISSGRGQSPLRSPHTIARARPSVDLWSGERREREPSQVPSMKCDTRETEGGLRQVTQGGHGRVTEMRPITMGHQLSLSLSLSLHLKSHNSDVSRPEPRTWTDLTLFRSGDSDTPRRYRNPDRIKIRHIQPIIPGFHVLTNGLNNISKH